MEMNEEAIREAWKAQNERMSRGFWSIGSFLFRFSQLEFTLKTILAGALALSHEQFDVVTAPYDFSMLCTVMQKILTQKNPEKEKELKEYFSECRELNNDRVRVAHGTWMDNGHQLSARHVARGTLKAGIHYQDPAELEQLIDKAADLMERTLGLGPAIG